MSNTDKTRQKLVNSMRKSKDAATNKPTPKAPPAKTAAVAKKTAKKSKPAGGTSVTAPTQATAPAKPRPAAVKPRQVTADSYQGGRRGFDDPYQGRRQGIADSYQRGRLVWPD